jgi:aryl-alcohol dehydrogenase-like predicted oxidoreductase
MDSKAESAALPRRQLGRTGIELTILGVGGWLGALDDPGATAAASEKAAVETVRRAVDLGIRYFDTSPAYGDGERYLGLGLRALAAGERAGLRLSTKVGTHPERPQRYDRDSVRWSLERSLEVLGCGRIDIVHVHDPATDAHLDRILGPGGAVEALEELKEEGIVGGIGLGVRVHRFLRRAIDSGRFDAILPSYDYHPGRDSARPVIELAFARGVGVINGSPYNAGLLAGLNPETANQRRGNPGADVARAVRLWHWCRERGVDPGALAVQYSLRDERISATLVGPRTAAEVEGNLRHARAVLPEGIWEELDLFLARLGPAPPGGEAQ